MLVLPASAVCSANLFLACWCTPPNKCNITYLFISVCNSSQQTVEETGCKILVYMVFMLCQESVLSRKNKLASSLHLKPRLVSTTWHTFPSAPA